MAFTSPGCISIKKIIQNWLPPTSPPTLSRQPLAAITICSSSLPIFCLALVCVFPLPWCLSDVQPGTMSSCSADQPPTHWALIWRWIITQLDLSGLSRPIKPLICMLTAEGKPSPHPGHGRSTIRRAARIQTPLITGFCSSRAMKWSRVYKVSRSNYHRSRKRSNCSCCRGTKATGEKRNPIWQDWELSGRAPVAAILHLSVVKLVQKWRAVLVEANAVGFNHGPACSQLCAHSHYSLSAVSKQNNQRNGCTWTKRPCSKWDDSPCCNLHINNIHAPPKTSTKTLTLQHLIRLA